VIEFLRARTGNNDVRQGLDDPLDVTQQGIRTAALKNQSANPRID